ncbi:MAG: septal ring lytic transglycosylase RlpA family lipoprotein, partial [Gammaproteobacteria bacterium]|nr:septal ring lytic transglycosylase RlpA family lipoprotein [Gammaproteobacteria bacterium]
MNRLVFPMALAVLLLAACAGEKKKEAEPGDGPSSRSMTAADVKDAVPANEPLARYGNHSPYTVLGKRYTV